MTVLNALSVCSGIGGLDWGLEQTRRIRTAGQVEIDPWCRSILAARWPGVPRHDDIRTAAEWWNDGTTRPPVHLFCGGIPCQPHSDAGRKAGTSDARWLWPAAEGLIAAVEPPLVLIENVRGLIRTGLGDVLRGLARLGFDAWWNGVPAAAFGAPHLRWRLLIIAAHPGRVRLAREPWTGPWREQPGYDGARWAVRDPGPGWDASADEVIAWDEADVADPERAGLENRRLQPGVDEEELPPAVRGGDGGQAGTYQSCLGRGFAGPASWLDGTWEAGISRVAPAGRRGEGTADRTARLRGIGNAVVPAVAEYAGRVLLGCGPEFL